MNSAAPIVSSYVVYGLVMLAVGIGVPIFGAMNARLARVMHELGWIGRRAWRKVLDWRSNSLPNDLHPTARRRHTRHGWRYAFTVRSASRPAQETHSRAGFDGGGLSSDGGLLLLREAERRLGIAGRLGASRSLTGGASAPPEPRLANPQRVAAKLALSAGP
jgi:hypothetical protein